MDDIYFSDKKSRRNNDEDAHSAKDRFTDGNHHNIDANDELKKRTEFTAPDYEKRDFSVNIPEHDFDAYRQNPQKSRTPQGERKAPPTRTPTGSRAPSGTRTTGAATNRVPLERKAPEGRAVPAHARTPQKPPVKPKEKKNIKLIIGITIPSILLVLILGIFGYGYYAMGNIDYDDSIVENAYIDESELASSPDVTNILIIGSDQREDGNPEQALVSGQRADSMILFTIDKKNKQLKLTSFLRDSYVYIPSEGYEDKLNAAYSLGGPQLTMDTLEYNFGVKIDSYLIINFEVFKQFINLLGGVPVEVSEYEAEYMVDELKFIYIKPGVNVMNGNASLMYCRMRYLDNDLYRTQRQRKVIKAVVGKAAKTNIFKLMDIVRQVVPNIRTDISRNELISLGAGAAVKFLHYDMVQQQIPADGTWWDQSIEGSGDVIVFNTESNVEALHEFVFEKYVEEEETAEEE